MKKPFTAQALPLAWGPWMKIQSHLNYTSFKITYTAIGVPLVMGKVRYYKEVEKEAKQVEEEFQDVVTISTANVVANIEVCFKGIPFGSAVNGEIE